MVGKCGVYRKRVWISDLIPTDLMRNIHLPTPTLTSLRLDSGPTVICSTLAITLLDWIIDPSRTRSTPRHGRFNSTLFHHLSHVAGPGFPGPIVLSYLDRKSGGP
ncbi:hypothetical protein GW17_00046625 [Ensete ventricosum]|nr:hypothetical protein GW17_00046625 [Ensete ventricosum]